MVFRANVLLGVCLVLILGGCATGHSVMRYQVDPAKAAVWPAPPEPPRYRYIGQLTGEENITSIASNAVAAAGAKFFKWLVGLTSPKHIPVILQRPQGVMVEEGRIYVTDVSRQAVYVFDENLGTMAVWEMATASERFLNPIGIASGPAGEILVVDAQLGYVTRLDHEGHSLGTFGKGLLDWPTGIARDPASGRIYVADTRSNQIKVFNDAGELLQSFGKHGEAPGDFNSPTFLSLAGGKLYVTDTLNSRVQVLTLEGKPLQTVGRRGLYMGDLPRPKGVGVDKDGNIYVVESYFDYLLVFNAEGDFLLPVGGTGSGVGQFYQPGGLWVDQGDRIYIADTFNGRVVILQFLKEGV